jgi:hypothetical protein
MQIVFSILTTAPRPLTDMAPAVPPALWEILKRAIARHPAERHPTIQDLKEELEEFLALHPAPAAQG